MGRPTSTWAAIASALRFVLSSKAVCTILTMVVTILAEKMAMRSFRFGEDMLISHKRRMGNATRMVSATMSAVQGRLETICLDNDR